MNANGPMPLSTDSRNACRCAGLLARIRNAGIPSAAGPERRIG